MSLLVSKFTFLVSVMFRQCMGRAQSVGHTGSELCMNAWIGSGP